MNCRAQNRIEAFASKLLGAPCVQPRIDELGGGLEAAGVFLIRACREGPRSGPSGGERPQDITFVVKWLRREQEREAEIYRSVLPARVAWAPRLLGFDSLGDGTLLYLEAIHAHQRWPWRDVSQTGRVVKQIAELHTVLQPSALQALNGWEYEAVLLERARETSNLLDEMPRSYLPSDLLRTRSSLRRIADRMDVYRRELLRAEPLGSAGIHGDVHSANVKVSRGDQGERIVLLDWGRARVGSPLEDVSSWLQSLGLWEPEAHRRHDTLLVDYLAARDVSTVLGSDVRAAYWLAAASNVLAGALLYHLAVAGEALRAGVGSDGDPAMAQARDAARIVRRAAAFWS